MAEICSDGGLFAKGGGFNDCYVHVVLEATIAGLAFIGVAAGLVIIRDLPRLRVQNMTPMDTCRGACCGVLVLVGLAEFAVGLSAIEVTGVNVSQGIGGACLAAAALVVAFWQQQEVKRGLTESLGLKLWWVLATLAQVITTYDRASKPGAVALALKVSELLLCVAATAAYLVPSGRRGSTREPPLLSEEDGISMVGGGGRFARSLSTREPSPEDQVGIIGWLAFSWFTPIVDLAFQRDKESGKLEPTDVYPLTNRNVAHRQLERLDQQWQVELQKEKPALLSAMRRAFFGEVFSTAWVKFLNDVLHFVGPFLLNKIINFVKGTGEEAGEEQWVGYMYAIGMVLSSAFQAFLMAHYFQGGYQTGMRLRTALILMSYSKALRVLPWPVPPPPEESAPAEPETRRCCKKTPKKKPSLPTGGMGQMTNIISADTDKFTFLMPYFNLIWSCPLQIIICFIMLFNYVSWSLFAGVVVMIAFTILSSTVAGKARKIQQEAMKAKDERLKMEVELLKIVKIIKFYAWENAIEDKVTELRNKELVLQLRYKLWNVALFLSFSLSPVLVALGTFASFTLAEGKNLDAATAFTSLSLFNILSFPLGAMPMMARFFMEAAVAKDRIEAFLLSPEVSERPAPSTKTSNALEIKTSKLQWPDKSLLLEEVDISVTKGEMLVIVGKTGVGKSGLLYALLGELPIDPADGKTYLTGSVGYCAQSAWIRNATLRDNITNSPSLETDERYEAVLDACAMRADLEVLPDGDQTKIGDRGINLSGGQKQRVALARAVYANPDIYVLDDVLSALDSHVASHICSKLLRGPLMAGKTVVLVTHSPKAVPLANQVVCLDGKKVAFNGSFEDFKASSAMSEEVIHEDEAEPEAEEEGPSKDEKEKADKDKTDKDKAEKSNGAKKPEAKKAAAPAHEERRSGAVSWHVYSAYAKACGGVPAVGAFLCAVAISEGSRNFSDAWLAHWSGTGGSASGLGTYALAALICLVTGVTYSTCRVLVGQRGSRVLHERCLHALLRAHMSFFDLTPNGQILNRLAEDTNILDYNLPQTMSANIIWFWRAASIVVVCMLVGWYLIILIVPMFLLYARLAKRYLPATRDLRRLDAAARSPIFSHFSESMQGVSTIRAMQQQERALHTNVSRLESQMEAYYLSNTAARWLSLRLQFNGTILVGAVSILGIFLATNKQVSAGLVGLAITYALRLTDTLNQVNRESADRETQMVSVERVQNYVTNVKQEAALRIPHPRMGPTWPSNGNIQVDGVVMRYREGLPTVLNGICLEIKAGQRVGIVGRTGCGKSSFLSTLLRLVELEAGSITVDDVDISQIGLHDLRSKVAMIPQDPAILTGTVRFNLDPFGAKSDEELWEVLEKSQLRPRIESAGGLDSKVEEGGGNYSVGELQLLCLARALLRRQEKGGLLLLDEATSALDQETDQTIQKVIRSDFKCTIITIAHRIQTLMDYDKVAVFEGGAVVEFDSPQELLKRPSKFQALAKEGGVAT
ncbi:ABCC1 [Symbiodinium natans]|uniref:ABCC1 protein n=1 Tax=Symbiodinium natans TaxID=878477 RepID=A0A812GQX1_9DINO|nr:ABCC1 [Symbiodinium natans]